MPAKIPFADLTGQKFGRLTVLRYAESDHCIGRNARKWICRCECGVEKPVWERFLIIDGVETCGCIHAETSRRMAYKHGGSDSREYEIWCGIKARCSRPNHQMWKYYGGRGIAICERWEKSFEAFLSDMGPCPPGYQIDRYPDKNGNYEPVNCRWANSRENNNNRRNNRMLTYKGKTQTVTEWMREKRIALCTIWWRVYQGWTDAEIIEGRQKNLPR